MHCLQNPHSLSDDKGSIRRQWAGSPEPMILLKSVLKKPLKNVTGTHASAATFFSPGKSKAVCHWKIQPRSQIL